MIAKGGASYEDLSMNTRFSAVLSTSLRLEASRRLHRRLVQNLMMFWSIHVMLVNAVIDQQKEW